MSIPALVKDFVIRHESDYPRHNQGGSRTSSPVLMLLLSVVLGSSTMFAAEEGSPESLLRQESEQGADAPMIYAESADGEAQPIGTPTETIPDTTPAIADIEPPIPIPPPPAPAVLDPTAPAPIAPSEAITGGPAIPSVSPGSDLTITTTSTSTTETDLTVAPLDESNPSAPRAREFQGDDLGQVLRLLARQARINVVVSDQVIGTVTMRLEDVTALQAINVIARSKGLVIDVIENIYYIKTPAEKAAEPTESLSYTFSFARAENVAPLLAGQLQAQGAPPQVDVRTNTVFYREALSNIGSIQEFLSKVDRPTKQVMIEARLVETLANPTQAYGINWSGVVGSAGNPKVFKYGGSPLPEDGTYEFEFDNGTPGLFDSLLFGQGNQNSIAGSGFDPRTFGSFLTGQFAILSVPQLSLAMQFLNEDSDAEFLAHPRIVTADNLEATIKIVTDRPVPSLNFNEQTATAVFGGFDNYTFGTTLIVKPSINKDNWITLSVRPEISTSNADVNFQIGGTTVSAPIIDTRNLESNVLIRSGDTLAIGGLLQDETGQNRTKVPVLGDIPGLGYLFQSRGNVRRKRNLLIFITPTVINPGQGTGLENQASGLSDPREEFADPNGWLNNARGAYRVTPTEEYSIANEYPLPGQTTRPAGLRMKSAPPPRE